MVAITALNYQSSRAAEPAKVELLWPKGAPGANGDTDKDKPTLTLLPASPDNNSGAAVIICPGGGYGGVMMTYEGEDAGRWLNTKGVSAFVLNYRHAGRGYHEPAPLDDVQRAIRSVRSRAAEWKIDPKKIGVMGFSAGGHLASTAGTHFDAGRKEAGDPIDQQSSRPDFMILVYPVVTMTTPLTHGGSRNNLLGPNPDEKLVDKYSNEKQVTAETPPAFIVASTADNVVPAENSVYFYLALRQAKVPAELHVFEKGNHGFGLAQKYKTVGAWPNLCYEWLVSHGWAK
jgi:acetyl esterase/lipase